MEMPLPRLGDDLSPVLADADDYDNFSYGDIFQ
jgi:hypothetical protein